MREPKEVVNVMIPISVMDKVCQIAEKERKTIINWFLIHNDTRND